MERAKSSKLPPPPAPESPPAGNGKRKTRWGVNSFALRRCIAALILFLASTVWFCWLQPPYPDVNWERQLFSWDGLWQPLERNPHSRLPVVPFVSLNGCFFTNNIGWVVGEGGVILHSMDGGESWTLQTNIDWGKIEVRHTDQRSNAMNKAPIIEREVNVANQGPPVSKGVNLQNLPNNLPAKIKSGSLLTNSIPNRTAMIPVTRTPSHLNAVYFVDPQTGWIVGDNGTILKTSDGGKSWQFKAAVRPENGSSYIPATLSADLHSVCFLNEKIGWVVGAGTILRTESGGETWFQVRGNNSRPSNSGASGSSWSDFTAVQFLKDTKGFVADTGDALLVTTNGSDWEIRQAITNSADSIFFTPQHGWAVGGVGSIIQTSDEGTNWISQYANPKQTPLHSIHFGDAQHGIAVGDDGLILRTTNGGTNWTPQSSIEQTRLNCVRFGDERQAWAVGEFGLILRSTDHGRTWLQQTGNWPSDEEPYSRWPAPLFYLSLATCVGLVMVRVHAPKTNGRKSEATKKSEGADSRPASIDNYAVCDRPLTSKDFDALNFGPLAEGIAKFLRNKSTRGPLTLAVTGPWGSGKSSIMGLLKEKLQGMGIRPVWFNAWHHQDEQQLLAALLENIREQAIPSWFSFEGLYFRWNLISRRIRRLWPVVLLCAVAFAILIAVISRVGTNFEDWFSDLQTTSLPLLAGKAVVFVTALVTLFKTFNGLKAFGVDPAKLLSSLRETAKISDLGAQTSFRYRFAQEFEEVTDALHPLNMTIFIDDLDRCEPEQVMQVMQSLNFLASWGNCFLIIGMEEIAVTNCVAISLARQFVVREGDQATDQERLQQQLPRARSWMEKLIQIRIPVPDPNDEQFQTLLVGEPVKEEAEKQKKRRLQDSAQWLWETARPAVPWIAVATSAIAAFALMARFLDKNHVGKKVIEPWQPVTWSSNSLVQREGLKSVTLETPEPLSGSLLATNSHFQEWANTQRWSVRMEFAPNVSINTGAEIVATSPQLADTSAVPESQPPPPKTTNAGPVLLTMRGPQTDYSLWWLPLVFLPVFVGLMAKRVMQILDERYDDSDTFRNALRRWSKEMHGNASDKKTPRAAKRMINKVRFYAMMTRALKGDAGAAAVPENALVAFGVLEDQIKDGKLDLSKKLLETLVNEKTDSNRDATSKGSLNQDVTDLEAALQRDGTLFRYLSASVKVDEQPVENGSAARQS